MAWGRKRHETEDWAKAVQEDVQNEEAYSVNIEAPYDALELQHKAQRAAAEGYNTNQNYTTSFKPEDFYVVWSVRVLENWKALLSTDKVNNGVYIEVTHNGDKLETYVDVYYKHANIVLN